MHTYIYIYMHTYVYDATHTFSAQQGSVTPLAVSRCLAASSV